MFKILEGRFHVCPVVFSASKNATSIMPQLIIQMPLAYC